MNRRPTHSRGFATLVALAMLGMVAATMTLLITHLRFSVLRTSLMPQDAQLRQLLLAGAEDVAGRARQWGAQPPRDSWSIDLPSELSDEHATIMVHPQAAGADRAAIEIEAHLGPRRLSQSIQFSHSTGQWKVTAASMD